MIKRKRIVLFTEPKHQLINKHENGAKVSTLKREYNVGEQTVRDLIKNKSRLITFAGVPDSADRMSKRKSMKSSTYDELDQTMVLWFSQQRAQGIPYMGKFVLLKQSIFFGELKLQGHFNASPGWLTRFKQRHGVKKITVQGEKLSCDEPTADEFKNEIQKFIGNEGFIPEQIFNADKTGLYWKCLPKKTLAYKTETSAERRKEKTLNSFVFWKRCWDIFYETVCDRNSEKASPIFRS
jgi:hypothetical protein